MPRSASAVQVQVWHTHIHIDIECGVARKKGQLGPRRSRRIEYGGWKVEDGGCMCVCVCM